MSKMLSKTLSAGRLSELLQFTKLMVLTEGEEALDQSYLQGMVALAAQIEAIKTDHLLPATHAFDVDQRLREDKSDSVSNALQTYQKLGPQMVNDLFCVPAVIE